MGDIVKRVEDVLRDNRPAAEKQPGVRDMQELYLKLLQAGVISKPEYDLPLLDTVGCRISNAIRHQRHDSDTK